MLESPTFAAQEADENSGAGQAVYTVAATDAGDTSAGVTYSFFVINIYPGSCSYRYHCLCRPCPDFQKNTIFTKLTSIQHAEMPST